MSHTPNAKGLYRVYSVSHNNTFYVGIATKKEDNEQLHELSIMNVRLFDGTTLELLAGDLKFDC